MKSFREYLEERFQDPVKLAQRVAARYGKKEKYGKIVRAERGNHIPLKSFNVKRTNSVENKSEKIYDKLGGKTQYEDAHVPASMNISDLNATQPLVRIDDVKTLKNKISDKHPTHVVVATHKGKQYIMDGHHAVLAARLRGEKTIDVRHIDLDDY
jgi:hypothetical protein